MSGVGGNSISVSPSSSVGLSGIITSSITGGTGFSGSDGGTNSTPE
jgi:hypothetical protein